MKHILLLEDDPGIADLLSELLREEGYYVSWALRVLDAKEMLERTRVDLFVADILLPDGTAFAATDEANRRNVPCLLMTGSWPHMAQLEANGDFYLEKPFQLKNFTSQVLQRIGQGRN